MTALGAGDVLLGKYRVEGVIGEGGMGIIVAANHLQLGERVALKFLRREILDLPVAVERFISEARAAIRIKSEHVARVIDVNALEDGTPFIVMEYLEGETLSAYAERHRPLGFEVIVEFVLQICEAIAEAHALGIVHRDLKPANIFITKRADGLDAAKVLDFGISKATSALAPEGPDEEGLALGSPAYASPEQIQTPHDVDARSDLWSLGVILYELASGRLPFDDQSTLQLCGKVLHDEPQPLAPQHEELPQGLADAILRCLQKQRELRFNNVGELALALAPFAPARARASVDRIIRTVNATGARLDVGPLGAEGEAGAPHRSRRRGRRLAWAVPALLLVGALGLVHSMFRAHSSPHVFEVEPAPSGLPPPVHRPEQDSPARRSTVTVTRLIAEQSLDQELEAEAAAARQEVAPPPTRSVRRRPRPRAGSPSSQPAENPEPARTGAAPTAPNRRPDGEDLFSIRKP